MNTRFLSTTAYSSSHYEYGFYRCLIRLDHISCFMEYEAPESRGRSKIFLTNGDNFLVTTSLEELAKILEQE